MKLPRLQRTIALAEPNGKPAIEFQIWWQRFAEQIEDNFDSIGALETTVTELTSDDIAEGATNLYFTDARARAALSAGANITYDSLTGVISATGGGLTLGTAEVNLGSAPKHGGKFTISGSGLTVGKPVLIQQASGPYTGKGTRADEAEMDQVSVTAKVTDATTITAYWTSARRVRGNFKFDYQVSS